MKNLHAIMLGALLALHTAACAAGDDKHAHAPKHGGVVAQVNHVDVELVARPEVLRIHLRDHDKPVKLAGATAKLTLLADGVKTEVTLAPAGDVLGARGSFKTAGATAVALITLPGKPPMTARFKLK